VDYIEKNLSAYKYFEHYNNNPGEDIDKMLVYEFKDVAEDKYKEVKDLLGDNVKNVIERIRRSDGAQKFKAGASGKPLTRYNYGNSDHECYPLEAENIVAVTKNHQQGVEHGMLEAIPLEENGSNKKDTGDVWGDALVKLNKAENVFYYIAQYKPGRYYLRFDDPEDKEFVEHGIYLAKQLVYDGNYPKIDSVEVLKRFTYEKNEEKISEDVKKFLKTIGSVKYSDWDTIWETKKKKLYIEELFDYIQEHAEYLFNTDQAEHPKPQQLKEVSTEDLLNEYSVALTMEDKKEMSNQKNAEVLKAEEGSDKNKLTTASTSATENVSVPIVTGNVDAHNPAAT